MFRRSFLIVVVGLLFALVDPILPGRAEASSALAFTSISAGGTHSCGLTADGSAYCWGRNASGQLGDGITVQRNIPTPVSGNLSFKSISAGEGGHTCAVTTTGAGYCWGVNGSGQLGIGSTNNQSTPTPVTGGLSFSMISGGYGFSCGLTTAGAGYCWGQDAYGQLGDGTNVTARTSPTSVSGARTYSSMSAGSEHACAITAGGTVYCWGHNDLGAIGDGTNTDRSVPTAVGGTFASFVAGTLFTCALNSTGTAYCWGKNHNFAQLGDGTYTDRGVPTAVAGGRTYTSISVGGTSACGSTSTGSYCWGQGTSGQIGDGTTSSRTTPGLVSGGLNFSSVTAGNSFACGTTASGSYCWGLNDQGQLGDDSSTNRSVPTGPFW